MSSLIGAVELFSCGTELGPFNCLCVPDDFGITDIQNSRQAENESESKKFRRTAGWKD